MTEVKTQSECRIREYSPELKPYFESLNREWIEKFFEIESHDLAMFADPEGAILQAGGGIIFAEVNGQIVGTGALTFDGQKYELAKLAVTETAKGLGIGELMTLEILRRAREKDARFIQLATNSKLIPAIELYKKLGFYEIFRGPHPSYKRVDLIMEKKL